MTLKEKRSSLRLPTNLIISEGYKYLRLLEFEKAIYSFENVLKKDPNNTKSLLGRAKCFIRLARYKEAWHDFHHVIKINPKCTEAVYLKGVTEYLRGNFEKSFITYWEGHKLRPECDKLRQGYEMSKKAIENNLNADRSMLLTEKNIGKTSHLHGKDKVMKDDGDTINDYDKQSLFSPELKLLQDMFQDENAISIHSLCKDLFDYLRERQKFWKLQDPFQKKDKSWSMTYAKKNNFDVKKMNSLVHNLTLCKFALKEGKTKICIKKGMETLEILKSVSSTCFPPKNEIEAETLHYLGMAYLAEKDFPFALRYCELQLKLVSDNNLFQSRGNALRDLGEIYHVKLKYEKALQFFQESLQFIKREYSKAVILYKISDCKVHLNSLESAQNSANQCLEFAIRSQNSRLQFDVLLLLAEIAVKDKDMKVAEQYYKTALEIAIESEDTRRKDLENLLDIFEEVATNDSCNDEKNKITKISNHMKHTANSISGSQKKL